MIDMTRKGTFVCLFAVAALLFSAVPASLSSGAPEDGTYAGDLLIDYGNGNTDWVAVSAGATVGDTVASSLTAAGVECTLSGTVLSVAGKTSSTVGAADSGGSLSSKGTTGVTVTSTWHVFLWDRAASKWSEASDLSASYSGGPLAVAFYPDGIVPVETPDHRSSWTMVEADAENSANQTADLSGGSGSVEWSNFPKDIIGDYSAILYADGHAIVKYGYPKDGSRTASVISHNAETGEVEWRFDYSCTMYETTSCLIVGQYIYIPSTNGHIYRFEWAVGPGEGNSNVTTFDGMPWDSPTIIPNETDHDVMGRPYGEGASSMVCDSGAIYVKAYNGMLYCFDLDLRLVWSYQMGGRTYFTAPTVTDDYVAAGAYDGTMYILNKYDGSLICKELVYRTVIKDTPYGAVNTPVFVRTGSSYAVFTTYTDGRGMNTVTSGVAVYSFDGTSLTFVEDIRSDEIGSITSYLTRYVGDGFSGVIVAAYNGVYKVSTDGSRECINTYLSKTYCTHSAPTLVNGKTLYFITYSKSILFSMTVEGKVVGSAESPLKKQFSMAPVVVVDGRVLAGNDTGVFTVSGDLPPYTVEEYHAETPLWEKAALLIAVILVILAALWAVMRYGLKWEHPYRELHDRIFCYFFGENYTHNTKSKRKLRLVVAVGIILTSVVALASLCIGSETTMGVGEALSAAVSAIQKGGHSLTYEEMLIYNERLPRVIAAFAVGIGLSVAGAVYQAVIKNPLVEPYIMGVSSGAGTFAVAVITFGFTFFGFFSAGSTYLTAASAIVGGLLAFGCTMLLAEKTGGKSINYVLAGIVVGLVFSALQSLMMVEAGNKVSSALSWLYGSFANMGWDNLWLVLIPCLALSMVPLIWAKELNLVLLGEDQARQMGLDAKRFDRIMLILASVLTAFCVAFCGVIGFVGLVIPHLSRMIMGGDHRLMLPTAMAFGGFLMIAADLLSRILMTGYELPVGAITTIIGVPMFAYLLVRRGKSYDA